MTARQTDCHHQDISCLHAAPTDYRRPRVFYIVNEMEMSAPNDWIGVTRSLIVATNQTEIAGDRQIARQQAWPRSHTPRPKSDRMHEAQPRRHGSSEGSARHLRSPACGLRTGSDHPAHTRPRASRAARSGPRLRRRSASVRRRARDRRRGRRMPGLEPARVDGPVDRNPW